MEKKEEKNKFDFGEALKTPTPESETENVYSFNIVVLGDPCVGKSEIIDNFLGRKF